MQVRKLAGSVDPGKNNAGQGVHAEPMKENPQIVQQQQQQVPAAGGGKGDDFDL